MTFDLLRPSLQLTCSPEDSPAKTSALPVVALDWLENDPAFSLILYEYFINLGLLGLSSKTFPVCSPAIRVRTCRPSCTAAPDSAQRFHPEVGAQAALRSDPHTRLYGAFSIRGISEWPNDAVECSLSDILVETSAVPRRYYLSARACAGILRRSAKRGVKLPSALLTELQRVATQQAINTSFSRLHKGLTGMVPRTRRRSWPERSPSLTAAGACLSKQLATMALSSREWRRPLRLAAGRRSTARAVTVQGRSTSSRVRRLMPIECERLQGFPDNWTCVHSAPTRHVTGDLETP